MFIVNLKVDKENYFALTSLKNPFEMSMVEFFDNLLDLVLLFNSREQQQIHSATAVTIHM
tara:strand:- start:307 stop:486 length:180 start_codon:yes stop_codon:yes gene_type:complete